MAYTLTRYEPEDTDVLQQQAYAVRLVITTSDEPNFPAKTLVFHAEQPGVDDSRAWFEAVASPSQLAELPVDEPAAPASGEIQNPFFRLDEVTVIERHPDDLQKFVDDIVEELTLLQANLIDLANMNDTPTEVIVIT